MISTMHKIANAMAATGCLLMLLPIVIFIFALIGFAFYELWGAIF